MGQHLVHFLGLLAVIGWINVFASELVGMFTFLGVWSGAPESVLGMTLLALGNSIGDLYTNMAMAKTRVRAKARGRWHLIDDVGILCDLIVAYSLRSYTSP